MTSIALNFDTEYQPVLDAPTLPLTVQLKGNGKIAKLFIHPLAPIPQDRRKHPTFVSPFAPIDYFGWDWREALEEDSKTRDSIVLDIHMFYSFKDIEFLFAKTFDYREFLLVYLERTRRIRVGTRSSSAPLPWMVETYNEKGDLVWHRLSVRITDICAMQGVGGLSTYAKNVGVEMDAKETYTPEQKSRMTDMYLDDAEKFATYALGDLVMTEVKDKTNDFFNKIAGLIGLNSRPSWGMSTGKVVASMLAEWLSNKIGVSYKDFYKLTLLAGCKGITGLSTMVRNKDLLYTSMTDGGRAVKERDVAKVIEGILVDIDISGCYGNGLKNQKFAVGNPTVLDTPMGLREFLTKNKSQLLPGLWTARINWSDCPFKQDLLISKTEEAFTRWDLSVSQSESIVTDDEDDRCYGASMVLTTNNVYRAALTHDTLQVLKYYSAPQEWKWILDNATVESAVIYMKRHKVPAVTPKMLEGVKLSADKFNAVEASKEWVEVDLNELMTVLLAERSKHTKGTPMNTFLKLIINAMYGCIASEYFSEKGTGISNVVVGSNITARARVLAWTMAKGLHSHCSITDGGVFDVNKVLKFKKKSLNLLEGLHRDEFKDPLNRSIFVEQVPLMGVELVEDDMKPMLKKPDDSTPCKIDLAAWEHLKTTFPNLDIFSLNQFEFESKSWYVKLTMHSKVDYQLVDSKGVRKVALRGMPKVYDEVLNAKVVNPKAYELFDAIESGNPLKIELPDTKSLSLADWERDRKNQDRLTPHDTVPDKKTFYSDTPLGARYTDMSQYKQLTRDYDKARATGLAKNVKTVRLRDAV